MKMGRFHVVHFEHENTIQIVPENWIVKHACYWPPETSSSKLKKLVKAFAEPAKDWPLVGVRVLTSIGCYEKAIKVLKTAGITYNISSDSDTETKNVIDKTANDLALPSTTLVSSPTPTIQNYENFQQSVYRILEEIKQDQKEIKNELSELRKLISNTGFTATNAVPSGCAEFPVNSAEKLKELDLYLGDAEKFTQLCSYFGGVGGGSTPAITRKILGTIVSNDLSKLYNWKGTGGVKAPFSEFKNIARLITSSVRHHQGFEKTTEAEIHLVIKKWLAYANDRDGGRASRKKINI